MKSNNEIVNFLLSIFENKDLILKITLSVTLLSVIYSVFFYENEYTASVKFIPQAGAKGKMSSRIGSLAAYAGISLSNPKDSEIISPSLYDDIIESTPFLNKVASSYISDEHSSLKKIRLKEYYVNNKKGFLKKRDEGNIIVNDTPSIVFYSRNEMSLFKEIKKILTFDYNEKDNIIKFSCSFNNSKNAAQIVNNATEILKEEIIRLKTDKVKKELDFIDKSYKEKNKEFKENQLKLASYEDNNILLRTSKSKIKLFELKSNNDLLLNVCIDLKKQLESKKIELEEVTPSFIILQPIVEPVILSSKSRLFVIFSGIILGFFISLCYLFFKDIYTKFNILKKKND